MSQQKLPEQRRVQTALGERIKNLRKQREWSQTTLAEACAINLNHLGQIERGELDFSVATAGKIPDQTANLEVQHGCKKA